MMMVDHDTFELIKGGGLFALVCYLIYSDREDRKRNVEASLKLSEATNLMASALKQWLEMLNHKDRKDN